MASTGLKLTTLTRHYNQLSYPATKRGSKFILYTTQVSSANNVVSKLEINEMSLMYNKKSSGPRQDPWGTPHDTLVYEDINLRTLVYCYLFFK